MRSRRLVIEPSRLPPRALGVLQAGDFGDQDAAVVIKADGLAAGKGVFVAANRAEALSALDELKSGVVGSKRLNASSLRKNLKGAKSRCSCLRTARTFA